MARTGAPVTVNALEAFESELNAKLPDDYRDFLLVVNGGRTDKSHRTFKVKNDETTLNSLLCLNDPEESRDLLKRYERFAAQEKTRDLLPVGHDDGGSKILLGLHGAHRGSVWYLDVLNQRSDESNPRVLWHDRRDMIRIADNFRAFMSSLTPL